MHAWINTLTYPLGRYTEYPVLQAVACKWQVLPLFLEQQNWYTRVLQARLSATMILDPGCARIQCRKVNRNRPWPIYYDTCISRIYFTEIYISRMSLNWKTLQYDSNNRAFIITRQRLFCRRPKCFMGLVGQLCTRQRLVWGSYIMTEIYPGEKSLWCWFQTTVRLLFISWKVIIIRTLGFKLKYTGYIIKNKQDYSNLITI